MSLYGALYSGVSGLTAQSSAMGAISDNITNVSTVGYKNTNVNFQTLVTQQTSTTFYSAGGVQSRPRQAVDVQGLLQASSSQTDIAISGGGFFVVNSANQPGTGDSYFYTRAGSFKLDDQGYLTNSAGYYLQAWPTDASGTIIPANSSLTQNNLNVISTDYLESVNLSRVAGSAAATTEINVGANLPSSASVADTHTTDVQFFDSLGESRSVNLTYTKTQENSWDVSITPPPETSVLTTYDSSGRIYDSRGQLEFTARPADGSTVVIDGTTYEFDSDGFYGGAVQQEIEVDFTANTDAGWDAADTLDFDITLAGVAQTTLTVTQGGTATMAGLASDIATAINNDSTLSALITASAAAGVLTITSDIPDQEMTAITFAANNDPGGDLFDVNTGVQSTNTAFVTPTTTQVDVSSNTSIANDVSSLVSAVIAADTDFDTTNNRIAVNSDSSSTIDFVEDGTDSITIDPSALLDSNGALSTHQTSSFTVQQRNILYADTTNLTFGGNPSDGETIIINGITYEFDNNSSVTGSNTSVTIAGSLAATLTNLESAIETADAYYPSGTSVRTRIHNDSGTTNDTLQLASVAGLSYTINAAGMTGTSVTDAYGTQVSDGAGASTNITVSQAAALNFSDGVPSSINIAEIEIIGFGNGASDMDNTASNRMDIDFGTLNQNNGMTQFGDEFTQGNIQQNGSQFGTFSGVSVSPDGLVTALFDNGDTRPIYRVPVATFTNPNGLEGRTGNVWNASDASGDYTLRTAGNGSAGVVTQGSLESSTVDIGEEFTDMIVVQRAYSASTKIISTADEMLQELMRVK